MACVCSQRGPSGETHDMAFCAERTTALGGGGAVFSLAAGLGSLCAEAPCHGYALCSSGVSAGDAVTEPSTAPGSLYRATGPDLKSALGALAGLRSGHPFGARAGP